MILEDNLKYSLLCEVYSQLLTQKQQKLLKDFLDNNLSISELAVEYNSTRQAVNDLLKRTFKVLEGYEEKLGLLKKFESVKLTINEAIVLLNKDKKEQVKKKLFSILEVL